MTRKQTFVSLSAEVAAMLILWFGSLAVMAVVGVGGTFLAVVFGLGWLVLIIPVGFILLAGGLACMSMLYDRISDWASAH